MEDKMLLTAEEKEAIQNYQRDMNSIIMSIGILRKQFSVSEIDLITKLEKVEGDLRSHLKVLAKNRGMPDDENWIFDPNTYGFRKQ